MKLIPLFFIIGFTLNLLANEPQYCISGCNSIKYWRISDATCLRTINNDASSIAISPDGQYALSGSWDDTLNLKYWCISDGVCIKTFTGHSSDVNSVAISPNGQYALSASDDTTLKYWRISDGTCIRTFTGYTSHVYSVVFSSDGQFALSGAGYPDRTLKYWCISDGTCIRTFTGHGADVLSVAISPDGQYALSGSMDCTLKYWQISDGTCIRTLYGHNSYVTSVAFSPDGQYALSGSDDKTLKYWSLSVGACIRTFMGHTNMVNSVAMSTDGQYALSGSWDNTLKYWLISDGSCIRTFSGHDHDVKTVFFNPLNLSVTSPNGGEVWEVDSQHDITWSNVGEDSLIIYYSTNNGSNWYQITKTPCTPNSYTWTIPNTPSTQCLVKVTSKTGIPADQSDAVFTIKGTGFTSSISYKALPMKFSASPNPFTTRLYLSLPIPASVYSLTGSLITSLPKGKHSLDTNRWQTGIYIIRCGKETKRLVKLN